MGVTHIGKPFILIKCMEKRWIERMYENGEIRLSCPGKWIKYEQMNGLGQGDKFEGTFKITSTDTEEFKSLKKRYGNNLIENKESNYTYYQLHTVIGCPTFCFYTIEDSDIKIKDEVVTEGSYEAEYIISGEFFQDFAKGKGISREDINNLPEDEQPAMLIIKGNDNIETFLARVKKSLKMQYGLCDSNILIKRVEYEYTRNMKNTFSCKYDHPYELFYKNRELKYQNEARVVINSKKYRFKNYCDDYLDLKLGSLKDCSEMFVGYHPEGVKMKMKVDVSRIGDILKRKGKITTGYEGNSINVLKGN